MARSRSSSGKKKNSIVKLEIVVEKLQRSLSLSRKSNSSFDDDSTSSVPEDVKEGHFAVIAVDKDQPKRFVVPLSYLTHPTFLKLLEQAAEVYGFDHEGALMVPCPPSELEKILDDEQWQEKDSSSSSSSSSSGVNWSSCKAMVQSY